MYKLFRSGRKTKESFCIVLVTIILSTLAPSIADCYKAKADLGNLDILNGTCCNGPRTYYNATLFIVTNLYYVEKFNESEIDLEYRCPALPGIFIVKDEEGVKEFNLMGGWYGSRVEIYHFSGFFKPGIFYTILVGKCAKISIIPVR